MVPSVLDVLFGCSHRRFTFPITPKRKAAPCAAAEATGTYVVCLDCGQEFPYDWRQMKILPQRQRPKLEVERAFARSKAA